MKRGSRRPDRPKAFAEIVQDVESDDSIVVRRQPIEPPKDSPWFVDRWIDGAGTKWKVRRSPRSVIRLLEDPSVPARECDFLTGKIRTFEPDERAQVIERILNWFDSDDPDECDWPPEILFAELRNEAGRSEVLVSFQTTD